LDIVFGKHLILCHKEHIFMNGLRYQEPVKWVFVIVGQTVKCIEMLGCDV